MAALGAYPGTRIEAVGQNNLDSISLGLIAQLLSEGIEFLCGNLFGKILIPHHAFHVEVLDDDERRLGFHDRVRCLMDVIVADVRQAAAE